MFETIGTDELVTSVPDFLRIYRNRPIVNNRGGMGLNHSWATWFITKHIKPKVIIESGIHRGHSTWLLEKASPSSKIFSFDIDLRKREFISKNVTYGESDFFRYDWSAIDLSDSLVFFDDHQNHFDRVIKSKWLGIRNIILEDVFPIGQGDCYSLKHIKAGTGATALQMSEMFKGSIRKRLLHKIEERILKTYESSTSRLVRPNGTDYRNLMLQVEEVYEFPPLFLEDYIPVYGGRYIENYSTKNPILKNKPLDQADYSFYWLTYIRLK